MLIPPLFQFGYKVKLNKQGSGIPGGQWFGSDFTAKDPGSLVQCSQNNKKTKWGSGPQNHFICTSLQTKVDSI